MEELIVLKESIYRQCVEARDRFDRIIKEKMGENGDLVLGKYQGLFQVILAAGLEIDFYVWKVSHGYATQQELDEWMESFCKEKERPQAGKQSRRSGKLTPSL